MKSLLRTSILLFFLPNILSAQTCVPYDFQDIWRVAITITNVTAGYPLPVDMVIPAESGGPVVVTGQLTPGVNEHPVSLQIALQYPSGNNPSCTAQVKTYSLLEKAGYGAGNRMGGYLLTLNPAEGTVTGTVQFQE